MYCWGDSANGRLGYTGPDRAYVDDAITGGSYMSEGGEIRTATAISAGSKSSCTIANAVILCWGDNTYGQLGTGDTAPSVTPIKTTKYQIPSSAYALGPIF